MFLSVKVGDTKARYKILLSWMDFVNKGWFPPGYDYKLLDYNVLTTCNWGMDNEYPSPLFIT
jgi:hypothetical protein